MYKIGENEMVLCPYNRSHVVSKLRLQKHIIKCKVRHPEVKLITCFYNYTHRLRPEEVLKHYEICSQKIRMEEARYCKSQYNFFTRSVTNDNCIYGSDNDRASLLNNLKTNFLQSSVNANTQDVNFENSATRINLGCGKEPLKDDLSELVPLKLPKTVSKAFTSKKDGVEDLKPLNLPKNTSKAFTVFNQQRKTVMKEVPVLNLASSRGFGRGQYFKAPPAAPPRTNDHLLPDVSDINSHLPENVKSKFFTKIVTDKGNSCSASVISSLFDDGTTLKSDDITFVDDDDDNDGFIFKNFDKYVKI